MGHNIGLPGDLLYYKLRDYEASVALAILHDVPVRCEKESDFDTVAAIYRIRDMFRCHEATFHGYWEVDTPVRVADGDCHASYWQHPTNGILVAVSNLAAESRTPGLTLDRERLGLGPAVKATDVREGSSIPINAETINVRLQGQSWTLIQIAPVAR